MKTPHLRPSGMPGLRRLVTVLAAMVALVLVPVGAASAGSWSHVDPAKDVWGISFEEEEFLDPESPELPEEEEEFGAVMPEARMGDIRRVAAAHNRSTVAIRFSMRASLPRSDWGVMYQILTPDRVYQLTLSRFDGAGEFTLTDMSGYVPREIACRGMQRTIDRSAATVRVVVPRSCLRKPRFIRFGLSAYVFTKNGMRIDDGLVKGQSYSRSSISPRIYRG